MTRKRFDRLVRALHYKMVTEDGMKQDGEMLRNLENKNHKVIIKTYGSYAACWEWLKFICDAYEMK